MPRPKDKLGSENRVVDLLVYNDTTLLSLYADPVGKAAPPISDIADGAKRELAFVLPLCQDDSYVLRVRLGGASAAENREHIGFAAGHIDLSSGVLRSGESVIEVPRERFRIEVRSFIPHSMGRWQCKKASGRKEKLATFWRRTRKGQSFPDWLRWECSFNPNDDPGHENQWRGLRAVDEMECGFVDFLACLLRPTTRKPVSKVSRKGIAEWEIRCPSTCPAGIKAPGLPPPDDDFVGG